MKANKERLESVQKALGLNQREFGIYVGVSARTINSWMTGERKCPTHVVELVERAASADLEGTTTTMMRWAIIDSNGHDESVEYFGSKAEALRKAKADWARMAESDKRRRTIYAVALLKAQYIDGKIRDTEDGDWYGVCKDFLEKSPSFVW